MDSTNTGRSTIATLIRDLAARQPTPGGGAAAAVAAALGCAAGAMAARYTTGPKWGANGERAQLLAEVLEAAAADMLQAADDDAAAFAAMQQARKDKIPEILAVAEQRAAAVPAALIQACARHAAALREFLSVSNPHLVSDVKVGIHLLAGAGRAAWQTLLINQPPIEVQSLAQSHLSILEQCDRVALGGAA